MKEVKLNIDPNWTYPEAVCNLKALKASYEGTLRLFNYFDIKLVVNFKQQTRDSFYALNIPEWQSDKLWEYMNGFIPYNEFVGISAAYKKKIRQNNK